MTARVIAFRLFAAGCVAAAVYHAVGIAAPTLVEHAPAWRHALFVGINAGLAAGFLLRPRWFVYAFALLVVEQVYGHGLRAVEIWGAERRVDWPSVIVLATMPVMLALLVAEAREGKMRSGGADGRTDQG